MSLPIQSLVIVGDGAVAWWAAVFLKKTNPAVKIVVLKQPEPEPELATTEAEFSYFLRLLGISEPHFMEVVSGNFCIAQAFDNWSPGVERYVHTRDTGDFSLGTTDFNQWLLKLRLTGERLNWDDFSILAACAKAGKSPVAMGNPNIGAGLNFKISAWVDWLKGYGAKLGIDVVDDRLKQVVLNANGAIESIVTEGQKTLRSDFYIDTQSRQSVLGQALNLRWESWSDQLPCNRLKTLIHAPQTAPASAFNSHQLVSHGWLRQVALRQQLAEEFSYSDQLVAESAVADPKLRRLLAGDSLNFQPGMRSHTWHKNCLALGSAALIADRFSHSPLYLAAETLKRFVDFWPCNTDNSALEAEFNRVMRLEYQGVRDYHCAHYWLANKQASAFGELLRALKPSETLSHRLALFADCGRISMDESTLVSDSQWTSLLIGLGFWPKHYDYLALHHDDAAYLEHAQNIAMSIKNSLASLPDYGAYLRDYLAHLAA
jgi:tryptophan halogenase